MHAKPLPTELPQRLLQRLSSKYGPGLRAAFLVGSYARGEADAWSDINLLAITESSSEDTLLLSSEQPVSVRTRSVESFLTDLYSPEGQEAIDWWLLAGCLQDAVSWLDKDGLLATAQRIIAERRPRIELYGRILWDDQLAVLEHWGSELRQAAPFSDDYLLAVSNILQRAETALLIFNAKPMPCRDIGQLSRPKSFLADWTNLLCLGVEPKELDQHLCFEALAQVVGAICNAKQSVAPSAETAWTDRWQLLSMLAGDTPPLELTDTMHIPLQLGDQALALLWSAKAGLERREPAKLAAAADRLWSLLAEANLLQDGPLLQAMRLARIPQAANSARVLAAAERLQQGLQTLGQTPTILPQPSRRRTMSAQGM